MNGDGLLPEMISSVGVWRAACITASLFCCPFTPSVEHSEQSSLKWCHWLLVFRTISLFLLFLWHGLHSLVFGGDYWRQTQFRPSCNYFASLCQSRWVKTGCREKARQTGKGRREGGVGRYVVISNERLTKSLGTGFGRCRSCENSWEVGEILFFGAGVWKTLWNFSTCP